MVHATYLAFMERARTELLNESGVDLARMAEAQGALGIGPLSRVGDLRGAFARAIEAVDQGRVVVIDVRIMPGYTPSMAAALTPGKTR